MVIDPTITIACETPKSKSKFWTWTWRKDQRRSRGGCPTV